jgi:predicted KAP-like P-loop ATPase
MRPLMDLVRQASRIAKNADPGRQTQRQAIELGGSIAPLSRASWEFDPDHPIPLGQKEDRLGFRSVASTLASSLLTQATSQGLVVSIEGVWGSGKSSLVNLLAEELLKNQDHAPSIVRFEPWLVGNRDGMLAELMADLALAVQRIAELEVGRERTLKPEVRLLVTNMLRYASRLSRQVTPVVRLAGHLGVPGAELASKGLEASSDALDSLTPPPPLRQVKQELTKGLSTLKRRIVVVIDDLDRLEPREAEEVVRLLRAVADFPNVIYILCYDPQVLASTLQEIASVDDGAAFLEKIVQVTFKVPRPEAFDLRRWLLGECLLVYEYKLAKGLLEDQMQRLYSVCDVEGTLLETPRDVVRIMNAIRLCWYAIHNKVDYADLVWLQMVRIKNEALYAWIERYLVEYAAFTEGAAIEQARKIDLAVELRRHLTEGHIADPRSMWRFQEFVPGVRPGKEDKDTLFNREGHDRTASSERCGRLASPQHSRYYFAFSKSAGALEDSELYSVISSAEHGANLEDVFTALMKEVRPQGGTKFDVLIDRLNRLDEASLPKAAGPPIMKTLADCADAASDRGQWGVRWTWQSAERLFKKLASQLSKEDRRAVMRDVFAFGRSIGWLTVELVGGEISARGRFGSQTKPEERFLSDEELNEAIALLRDRFRSIDRDRLVKTPELLTLMYAWREFGDEDEVSEWVREQEATDERFLALLSACRGWMASDKVYYPLNRRDLTKFLDFDKALERLRRISENPDRTDDEKAMAKELFKAAELGKDD